MVSTVKERLIKFIEYKHLGIKEFQRIIGVSPSYVLNISQSVGPSKVRVIIEKFPELNTQWLLKGEGNMLLDVPDMRQAPQGKLIPVLPVSAQAGSLSGFSEAVHDCDCEKMVSPVKDAEFAIPITGESMSPEYPNGSKILIKKINERAFIDWGRTFVLDTCNGTVIKNIYPGSTEDTVKCVSINDKYPSFEVRLEDIIAWYRVICLVALK